MEARLELQPSQAAHRACLQEPPLKPHAQVHLLSPIDKCKVCNEPAAKHVHYGAMSCFSCRAFFRRSIQNNTYGTYQCRRAKACSITLKTRRNCQWCRYQRCLAVGMKPSWVLSSDERERRFRKNRDKKEKKEASAAQSAGVSPPPQSPGHAVVLPSLPHHLVTVKTDLFPVSTAASSSPTAPQFATIQMIPSGGLRLENPRPQLLPHTGVIVRQYSRFPPPLQSLPPVDLRVKLEAPSHLGEVAHPVLGLEQQQLGQVQKMEGSPLPSPPPLTPFVSEACSFNQSDDSEYEDSVYSRSDSDGEAGHSCRGAGALLSEPEIKFTSEELSGLQILVERHDEQYKSVNFGETLIKEMIMCSMFGIPVSMSAAISGYRLTVERITRIANNLETFGTLPKFDQNSLLKENADLLVSMRGAIFFDSRKKGVNQVLISMGIDDMDTIKTMFTPLMKEDRMKHIDYKTFNSIQQVNNSETEVRYNFLQGKVAAAIGDEIITTLLTYIILFSIDFCPIADRRRIECIQERYIRMLERYVYSKHPRHLACHTFATCLNAVTCIREMADIKKRRAMNMSRTSVPISD